jgi:origin recognition complex subunit 4
MMTTILPRRIANDQDTLLLLEKRVKSRFSHRVMRVTSPLAPGGLVVPDGEKAWRVLTKRALLPWLDPLPVSSSESADDGKGDDRETERWKSDWAFAIDVSASAQQISGARVADRQMLLKQDKVVRHFDRLTSLTTDVRNLYRPFVRPRFNEGLKSSATITDSKIPLIPLVLSSTNDFLSIPQLTTSLLAQVDGAGWGIANAKLKGLSQPALTILVAAKHLNYAGKEEFNFAQVNEEYVRFVRTRLVGSGRGRWVEGVLQRVSDIVVLCTYGWVVI